MLSPTGGQRPHRRRAGQSRSRWLSVFVVVLFLCLAGYLMLGRTPHPSPSTPPRYDCIIIPGGGLDGSRAPAAWVRARLDAALAHDEAADYYLVLSRGTTHKPPPLDEDGFPVDEAAASAAYLVARGVAASRVLLESWSLDTIGNAAFARLMHADLRGWSRLLVITSALHMPRTRAIFEWVFALPPALPPALPTPVLAAARTSALELEYEEVTESGLADDEVLQSRRLKEEQALRALRESTIPAIRDLRALHDFLFVQHGAYRARTAEESRTRRTPGGGGGAHIGSY